MPSVSNLDSIPLTEIDRRSLFLGMAAASAWPVAAFADRQQQAAFVTCCQRPDSRYAAAVLDAGGQLLYTEDLPGRGHDAALSPDRSRAIVFARRPGRFALVLDLQYRREPTAFSPPEDRHFYGHGFFSPNGQVLFATENDFEAERGVLGLYDVGAGFRRIGEIETHGIGPHEAILMSDGKTICVANGGIATHPDYPRQKLNLPTMAPCLTYLDASTGDLIDKVSLAPDKQKLSLRHMTEASGRIWFGGQYEGARTDATALVGMHRPGKDIVLADAPPETYARMNHYIGSVATSADGMRVATASPRGGRLLIWNAQSGALLETRTMSDVCGVATSGGRFLVSGGADVRIGDQRVSHQPGYQWDNHIATR